MMKTWFISTIVLMSAVAACAVERPSEMPHPRLLFPASAEAVIKKRIADDPLAAQLQKTVMDSAELILTNRTCRFEKRDGRRLLYESRLALHQIIHCAWAWRMTGKDKFRRRVLQEMDAACAMDHWNPDHFLDTAEMTLAVTLGYDWLYPSLSEKQRDHYASQIEKKGLQALEQHKKPWWTAPKNNWSQVCGAGMAMAAIALDERYPELCAKVLKNNHQLVDACLAFYQPDGAYPEGPAYWHYGTNYHVMHLAAMEGVFGKSDLPAIWGRTAEFMIHITGPSGNPFNFADGRLLPFYPSAAQSWIATRFPKSSLPRWTRDALEQWLKTTAKSASMHENRFHPLHLLWMPSIDSKSKEMDHKARFGGEQEIAFARTNWKADAAWLAIKGGTGAASHGHLDAGTFVYEAGGVRWFCDLGPENYNLPGYFADRRWEYLRANNRSHNTWVIGDALQLDPKHGASVTAWQTKGDWLQSTVDLTPVYAKQCERGLRHVSFHRQSGNVHLKDEILKPVAAVRWAVVTNAKFSIEGKKLLLQRNGKKLLLEREDNSGGSWQEFSLKPNTEKENQNNGYRLLGFSVPPRDQLQIQVRWQLVE